MLFSLILLSCFVPVFAYSIYPSTDDEIQNLEVPTWDSDMVLSDAATDNKDCPYREYDIIAACRGPVSPTQFHPVLAQGTDPVTVYATVSNCASCQYCELHKFNVNY